MLGELQILDILVYVLVGGFTLFGIGKWLYNKGVPKVAGKAEDILEKVADALDAGALIVRNAGAERVADVIEAFADVPDELGDVAGLIEDMTENQEFTKEKFLQLWDEGKEVAVAGKQCIIVIKQKPTVETE